MNPHRPRKPRQDGAARRYLNRWRRSVERAERVARKGGWTPHDCPCCEVLRRDDEARAGLEVLMRRAGRRGHRLRVAVARLDARLFAVTVVKPGVWESAPWWEQRQVDWER